MEIEEKIPQGKNLPDFDADLSPYNVPNVEAARARGLEYDSEREVYVDEDGCPTRDEYGQPLG